MGEKLMVECSVCGQVMRMAAEEYQKRLKQDAELICDECKQKGEGIPVVDE